MSKSFPLHQHMLDLFLESVGRGEVKKANVKTVTTIEIYVSRMDDMLMPPKAEAKFPLVNFQELVYPRIASTVLKAKQKDLLFVRASCVRHMLLVYHCFHVCSSFFFLLSSAHPSLQPPTKNSRKRKLLGSALVTERSSGKLSGSPQGLSIPLDWP